MGLTWIDKRNKNKVLVTLYTINKEDASQKGIIASSLDDQFVKDSETLSHHRDFASINCFWLVLSTKARLNKKSVDDSFSKTSISTSPDNLPFSVIRSKQTVQPNNQKPKIRQQIICYPTPLPATRQGRVLFAPDLLISFRAEALCFVGTTFALIRWLCRNDSKKPNTNND